MVCLPLDAAVPEEACHLVVELTLEVTGAVGLIPQGRARDRSADQRTVDTRVTKAADLGMPGLLERQMLPDGVCDNTLGDAPPIDRGEANLCGGADRRLRGR